MNDAPPAQRQTVDTAAMAPPDATEPARPAPEGPHVVIVGAGFAGLYAAKGLGRAGIATTIIDRQNYHLFQPLLYQVATAALSPADIAEPIRRVLRPYDSIDVVLGEVVDVDTAHKQVRMADGSAIGYDRLILATGSTHSYFGHDEWARYAPGLKTIDDARLIRSRLLMAFEKAEREQDPVEQRRLLTVAVIGGGPTGVEMAGSIAELSHYTLARDFRHIQPDRAQVLLIEAGPRILAPFPEDLADYARRRLEKLGVSVRVSQAVESVQEKGIVIGGTFVPVGLTVWGAGVAASPAGRWLGVETDRAGRVAVDETLAIGSLDGVFVLGDLALAKDETGKPLPGLAQVAKQQGEHLGRELSRNLRDGTAMAPFRFRNRGNTAIVGRHAAIFDFGRRRLKGGLAWFLWAVIHVYLLVGFQNRLTVTVQWLWRYITYQRGARLITGGTGTDTDQASSREQ